MTTWQASGRLCACHMMTCSMDELSGSNVAPPRAGPGRLLTETPPMSPQDARFALNGSSSQAPDARPFAAPFRRGCRIYRRRPRQTRFPATDLSRNPPRSPYSGSVDGAPSRPVTCATASRARSGGHDASHPPARCGAAAVSHRARRRDGQALTSRHRRRLTRALMLHATHQPMPISWSCASNSLFRALKRQEKADGRVWADLESRRP
jgi:hypothetical protein